VPIISKTGESLIMLAYVDIEHEKNTNDPKKGPPHIAESNQRATNIGEAIGLPCVRVHYRDFSVDWMRRNGVNGFFISGNAPDWVEYDWENFKPLQDAVCGGDFPVLAFCGGHQLIGMTYGAACDALGPLEPGETDLMPDYHPGMRKEKGYLPLQIKTLAHPLFEGFSASGPVVMESHYWELKELPGQFDLLASTDWCKIQVMQHRELPIYSTQGHPEAYTAQYPDGKRLIRNFALATGIIERG
jgi:GMP synthase-like glutamine amidotransferase